MFYDLSKQRGNCYLYVTYNTSNLLNCLENYRQVFKYSVNMIFYKNNLLK